MANKRLANRIGQITIDHSAHDLSHISKNG